MAFGIVSAPDLDGLEDEYVSPITPITPSRRRRRPEVERMRPYLETQFEDEGELESHLDGLETAMVSRKSASLRPKATLPSNPYDLFGGAGPAGDPDRLENYPQGWSGPTDVGDVEPPILGPFLRKQVRPAVGDVGAAVGRGLDKLPGQEYERDGVSLGGRSEDTLRAVSEAFVPSTYFGIGAELAPGVGTVPGAVSAGRKASLAIGKKIVEEAPEAARVGRRAALRLHAGETGAIGKVPGGDEAGDVGRPRQSAKDYLADVKRINRESQAEFAANPEKYTPQANGWEVTYRDAQGVERKQFFPAGEGGRAAMRQSERDAYGFIETHDLEGLKVEPVLRTPPTGGGTGAPDLSGNLGPAQRMMTTGTEGPEPYRFNAGRRPPDEPPIEPPAPPSGPPADIPPTGGTGEPFAANIRLSKYPEDIRGPIKEWADANPEAVQTARRGVRPDEQVLTDARALVDEMGGDFDKLQRGWKPGEAWNAEEVTAIRGTLRAKTDAVLEAAQAAKASDSSVNQANLVVAIMDQARVQEIVHGVTAEAGRALRAFREDAFDAKQAGDSLKLEELLKRVGGDRKNIDDIAAGIGALDLNDPNAVNSFIRNVQKPDLWDYVMEVWINSILSGPKTHIINAISNTVNMMTSPIERTASAAIENVVARAQRRQVERFFSEAPADAFGALEGLPEGIRGALSTLRHGVSPQQASKWEFRKTAFKGNLGRVIRAPGTALEAADTFNYAINYRAALNANIVRQARKEGLKGQALIERVAELKADPTTDLIKGANELADYRLLRQTPGKITQSVMNLREDFPPLRFVLPFLRTPVNLFKYGLERSPLGLLNPTLWRTLAAKSPEASDQIARTFLGSAVAAGVAWHFADGKITGPAPNSAAERDRFFREGKQPYAINIGGRWVSYQRLEPYNQLLSQVSAVAEAVKSKSGKSVEEKVGKAVSSIGTNLVSQTYLSGLSDLLNAIEDPDRFGAGWLNRQASSMLVPGSSLLRTVAQTTDPVFRQPRSILESVKATVPGLSRDVPAKLNVWGEEVQRESPSISPISVTPGTSSSLDVEIARLGADVGFVGKSIGGEVLGRQEQRAYQTLAGQASKRVLEARIASPAYQGMSDEQKESAIDQAVGMVRDAARAELRPSPDYHTTRGRQPIEEFVLDKLNYYDERERLGYNVKDVDRVALDKANPKLDAEGWRFGGKEPPALQSAAAVDQALAMNIPNRQVKLSNVPRPVNQDEGTLAAWKEHSEVIEFYQSSGGPENQDAVARQMFKGRLFSELDSDDQSRVRSEIRAAVRRQVDLQAALLWWGFDFKPTTNAVIPELSKIVDQYGYMLPEKK